MVPEELFWEGTDLPEHDTCTFISSSHLLATHHDRRTLWHSKFLCRGTQQKFENFGAPVLGASVGSLSHKRLHKVHKDTKPIHTQLRKAPKNSIFVCSEITLPFRALKQNCRQTVVQGKTKSIRRGSRHSFVSFADFSLFDFFFSEHRRFLWRRWRGHGSCWTGEQLKLSPLFASPGYRGVRSWQDAFLLIKCKKKGPWASRWFEQKVPVRGPYFGRLFRLFTWVTSFAPFLAQTWKWLSNNKGK